jgi:hypothetical protein
MTLLVPKLFVILYYVLKFNDKHEQHQDILLTARRGNELNISTLSEEPYLIENMQVYQLEKKCETLELISPSTLVKDEQGAERK